MTWLTRGEKPVSVTAITQHFQPKDYPDVDDESLIILKYKNTNAVIMGSWNWPFPRKDMELFGTQGKLVAHDKERIDIDYLGADGVHKMRLCRYQTSQHLLTTHSVISKL
ncbi:D-galactose 1-dehydrogenase [Vibrio ishigakensis]|uniref:D-galactose 1-dehydrogenase n=1 Tax=Vibrio ishigakensis TaxID=1481914 RepID=A0A0B8QMA3_9VIBR|nr:D-galactose 1-dehydrogenase [Vibrio ishigakensis]